MVLTGKGRGARPVPVAAPLTNAQVTKSTAVASSTEAVQQARGPLTASKTTHGRTTAAERAKARHRSKVGRKVMRELKDIEQFLRLIRLNTMRIKLCRT